MSHMDTLEKGKVTLSKADRCDRCGARALVQADIFYEVETEEGAHAAMTFLLFCGHHFDKHRDAIELQAMRVHDQREGAS